MNQNPSKCTKAFTPLTNSKMTPIYATMPNEQVKIYFCCLHKIFSDISEFGYWKSTVLCSVSTIEGNFFQNDYHFRGGVSINCIYYTIFSKVLCLFFCQIPPPPLSGKPYANNLWKRRTPTRKQVRKFPLRQNHRERNEVSLCITLCPHHSV